MARCIVRRSAREAGQSFVIVAFALTGLLVVFMALVDLAQLHDAKVAIDTGAQVAAVDGARLGLDTSTLGSCPSLTGCPPPARRLAITNATAAQQRVRQRLVQNLQSVAYLMYRTTPNQVAQQALISVVDPANGTCMRSPYAPLGPCYYDPFVAVQVTVPLQVIWGATRVNYTVAVVGSFTDNDTQELPATPIPTSTPAPKATFPVPGPTCDPSICESK